MPELLDATEDRQRWLRIWNQCGREPFAHPGFCQLIGGANDTAVALTGAQGGTVWLLPLLLRPLRELPWLNTDRLDATSPYGYGGPFYSGPIDVGQVLEELQQWIMSNDVASAFVRLSLDVVLLPERRTAEINVAHTANNVVVDLLRTPDELWANYEHKVRKNVKKALRAECIVKRDDSFVNLESFVEVYEATMLRRQASSWFHFDRAFFQRIAAELHGSFSVFSVISPSDEILSVELVLESDEYLYSFLGGTREQAFSVAPNDLLKHEVILYGQRTGRKGFILGGGYTADDGIFRYKRSFDPAGITPFLTVGILSSSSSYEALVTLRNDHYSGPPEDKNFFPAYRTPEAVTHSDD